LPKVTYIEHDETPHQIEVPSGMSVMEGAVRNGVPGIDADCTGNCACGTCHVYIDAAWQAAVGSPGPGEAAMLELANNTKPNSRLSCQIKVSDALDGLVVSMPASQH